MRWILVEAARMAVLHDPYWKARYALLEQRLGSNKATVVVARKLLVVVWHVLHEHEADCQANAARVAAKLMTYSYDLTEEQRGGMTTRELVRYHLMHLKLGDDLTAIPYGGRVRPLASVDEVLALHPELKSAA